METATYSDFAAYCYHQHDVECNQKYDRFHPYSFHLKMVEQQARLFSHLLRDKQEVYLVFSGCAGHDLIEDARLTYNEVKNLIGERVADIIYACTQEKGRDRDERHSESYYNLLLKDKLAVFVKICDIMANLKYSILSKSNMFGKHCKELPRNKEKFLKVYPEYSSMFHYMESLVEAHVDVLNAPEEIPT